MPAVHDASLFPVPRPLASPLLPPLSPPALVIGSPAPAPAAAVVLSAQRGEDKYDITRFSCSAAAFALSLTGRTRVHLEQRRQHEASERERVRVVVREHSPSATRSLQLKSAAGFAGASRETSGHAGVHAHLLTRHLPCFGKVLVRVAPAFDARLPLSLSRLPASALGFSQAMCLRTVTDSLSRAF